MSLNRANQNWPEVIEIMEQLEFKPVWPDTNRDRAAFERAMQELGESAPIRDLLKRAQEIKATL